MKRSQPEFRTACVVKDALDWGCRRGVKWTHFPAGEHRTEVTGARLKRMGVKRGVPDYLFFERGARTSFLELKSPKGDLSDEQKVWREDLQAMGYRYAVARTGQEAIEILSSWGILERVKVAA